MGRKFIIEEVEEESKFGCGSIVATIIIALVIGLCGGFKSCKEDKKTESRREPDGTTATLGESKNPITVLCSQKLASECFRIGINHRIQAAERSLG